MVSIIIPTLNASGSLHHLLDLLQHQTIKEKEILIIDSSSTDNTVEIAEKFKASITVIPREEFNHGTTRNLGAMKAKGDILVYMTQDAIPADKHALENLIGYLEKDNEIAAVYGRQLPDTKAAPFSAHIRLFNYPDTPYVRSLKDRSTYGFKTIFISNSFAAYRKHALNKIGLFKNNMLFGEDTHAVARLLLAKYKVAYAADARVYHSHNYTLLQEFKRYFDIGALHSIESWLTKEFGGTGGEGKKYIKSEALYLINNNHFNLIPEFLLRNALKYLGYNLGLRHKKIPAGMISRLSMNKAWWKKAGRT